MKMENPLNPLTDPVNPLKDPLNPLMDSLTDVEKAFLLLCWLFSKHEWIDNTMARECTATSSATVRRHMKRLVNIGVLEAYGTTRYRRYRLSSPNGDI
jgi:predicted ArsR family transcriptional regulator